MVLAAYLKIIQGKLTQPLPATLGGALTWTRRAVSTLEPSFLHIDEHEKKFLNLIKEKEAVLTDLERLAEEKESIRQVFTNPSIYNYTKIVEEKFLPSWRQDQRKPVKNDKIGCGMQFRSLYQEEGKLINILESIFREIENLSTTLGSKRMKKVFDLIIKEEVAYADKISVNTLFESYREATQYFDLIAYLFKNGISLKHNTTSEEVYKIMHGELSKKFPFLTESLLKSGVSFYLRKLHLVYVYELKCKLALCLSSSNIDPDLIDLSHFDWETFCASTKFSEQVGFQSEFSKLGPVKLRSSVQCYKDSKRLCGRDGDKWRSSYEERSKKALELHKETIMQIYNEMKDSVFTTVFETWKEGYHMDIHGDPEIEVQKLEKRFEQLAEYEEEEMI